MPQTPTSPRGVIRASLVCLAAACGARSELLEPDAGPSDASADGATRIVDAGSRDATTFDVSVLDAGRSTRTDGCAPRTCASVGATCGPIEDGCGGVLECGVCAAGALCFEQVTCGGGGIANHCGGCDRLRSCASIGVACGDVIDGCGLLTHCGSCPAPQTCGGGGVAGQCGCTPLTCNTSQAAWCGGTCGGARCGVASDGCGGVLDCGGCAGGLACAFDPCAGQGCVPRTCEQIGVAACGTPYADGCGAILDCGVSLLVRALAEDATCPSDHPKAYACHEPGNLPCQKPMTTPPNWDCVARPPTLCCR